MTINAQSYVGKVYANVKDAIKKEAAGTQVFVQTTGGFMTEPPDGAIAVHVDATDVILSIVDPRE